MQRLGPEISDNHDEMFDNPRVEHTMINVLTARRRGAWRFVPDGSRTLSLEALASLGRTVAHCRDLGPVPALIDDEPSRPILIHWKLTTDLDGPA